MGGRYDFDRLVEPDAWQPLVEEAVRVATLNLDALPCPAGSMTVVLGSRLARHPAPRGDRSRSRGRLQPQEDVRLLRPSGRAGRQPGGHDGRRRHAGTHRRGSLNVDDEGTPTQRTVLIEDGILCGYLQDRLNARLMGHGTHRQRPPRELRPPADAAHDQHLHAGRRRRSRGHPALGGPRNLRRLLRGRSGRHHQRQVRLLRQRGLPHRGRAHRGAATRRHPDRKRPRRPHARLADRLRPRSRSRRRVPAARTVRASPLASDSPPCAWTT